MRGATGDDPDRNSIGWISIHAPRAGRDAARLWTSATVWMISIHAPRAGRDISTPTFSSIFAIFQSTRPVRGATVAQIRLEAIDHISIHAPRAGRDRRGTAGRCIYPYFNPRAPCGARRMRDRTPTRALEFQSTRPVRGATPDDGAELRYNQFQSTRPVRGATPIRIRRAKPWTYFNPRAPCGARRDAATAQVMRAIFHSTRPVRGATDRPDHQGHAEPISIHAPRAGRDLILPFGAVHCTHFNPRAPCGARRRP